MGAATSGALQGEIAISLPAHVRLIVVAEELPALNEPLMRDILRALTVSPDQVLPAPERVAMLPQGSRCNSWRLGTTRRSNSKALRSRRRRLMNSGQTRRHAPHYGNKSANMNTISILSTTDLPAAGRLSNALMRFRGAKNVFRQRGERYLNLKLTADDRMAAFAITQVVLDEATLFNIAVDPDFQRRGWGVCCLSI